MYCIFSLQAILVSFSLVCSLIETARSFPHYVLSALLSLCFAGCSCAKLYLCSVPASLLIKNGLAYGNTSAMLCMIVTSRGEGRNGAGVVLN